jgi:hypothetical protein
MNSKRDDKKEIKSLGLLINKIEQELEDCWSEELELKLECLMLEREELYINQGER